MTIRYQRAPGTLRLERLELAREAPVPPPPPLPMRADWGTPAPPLTRHQRVMALTTPRPTVAVSRAPRAPARVTGAQLLRARHLQRVTQRDLAARMDCSRSAIAEAERCVNGRGRRAVLPHVAVWVEAVLREHGEWDDGPGETEAAPS